MTSAFVAFPIIAADREPGNDGNFCGAAASFFATSLSMAMAEPRTPAPTKGRPARSRRPWMVPSSPKVPCMTGKTTSMRWPPPLPSRRTERGVGGIGAHGDALAGAKNFGEHFLRAAADEPMALFGDADRHDFIFVGVEAANDGGGGGEETSCSPERPPKRTPMRSRFLSGVMGIVGLWAWAPVLSYRGKKGSCRGGSGGCVLE